jgi:hypothetical protein
MFWMRPLEPMHFNLLSKVSQEHKFLWEKSRPPWSSRGRKSSSGHRYWKDSRLNRWNHLCLIMLKTISFTRTHSKNLRYLIHFTILNQPHRWTAIYWYHKLKWLLRNNQDLSQVNLKWYFLLQPNRMHLQMLTMNRGRVLALHRMMHLINSNLEICTKMSCISLQNKTTGEIIY